MSGQRPVVLWDLDGTVLDPAGAITEGIAEALWACGFEAPENLERFVGPPIGESLRRFTDVPEEQIPQVVSVYRSGYLTEGLERTRIYAGIREVLQSLHAGESARPWPPRSRSTSRWRSCPGLGWGSTSRP